VRSASERLPSLSTLFASAVTSGEPYTGSVTSCRFAAGPLRGISALLLLRAVPAARLLAVADTLGVERTADDLVTHTGQVADSSAADQHDGVLLEVVADAGNVGGDLNLACQPDAGDLAQRGVRLLGRGRVNARAHATTLRALLERRRLVLRHLVLAALADQLLDRGQPSLRLPVVFLLSSSRVLAVGSRSPGPFASQDSPVSRRFHPSDLHVFALLRPPRSGVSRSAFGRRQTPSHGSAAHTHPNPDCQGESPHGQLHGHRAGSI